MQRILLFSLLIFISQSVLSQARVYSLENKKAQKLYEEAEGQFRTQKYDEVLQLTAKMLKEAPNFIEAYMMQGYVYIETKQLKNAITAFEKAIQINAAFFPNNFIELGSLYFRAQEYQKTVDLLNSYLKQYNPKGTSREKADRLLKSAEFSVKAIQNPVPFVLENLGPNINSSHADYNPVLNVAQNTLIFTRTIKDNTNPAGGDENIFVSYKKGDSWTPAVGVGQPLNSPVREGAPAISADGKTMLLTICESYGEYGQGREGLGSCDLFVSFYRNSSWTNPRNLGQNVNTNKFDSQPSLSSDGKTIYFSSARNGGYGESDIYKTEFRNGKFSIPVNLGPEINTPGKEEGVFIHPDNQTLYFTSNYHPGLGGADIFMSKKQADGSWGTPINLGYPINTNEQEWSISVDANGKFAYMVSDRSGGQGDMDIYQFLLPPNAKPLPVTYFTGKVYDKKTQQPLDAKIELIQLDNNQKVVETFADGNSGEFFLCLPSGKDYALNVSQEGYLFHSENFTLTQAENFAPYEKNVPLSPIEIGVPIVLKNIFFDTDKFSLKPESKSELEILVAYLIGNPTLSIEICGHTDNQGSKTHNLELSKNRAKAVMDYLVQNKIDPSRLSSNGYGDTMPIADNQTPAGRALNRRTEFKVTAK